MSNVSGRVFVSFSYIFRKYRYLALSDLLFNKKEGNAKLIFNFNLNFEDEIALILFSPAPHPTTPTEKVVSKSTSTSTSIPT